MPFRLLFITSIAALAFGATSVSAQTPAPAAPASPEAPKPAAGPVTIPPHNCVKPEFPGRLAVQEAHRATAFNKEVAAYGECIKKYIEEVKTIANAATAAGNGAIDEYNAFTNDLKAKIEAAKD